MSTLLSRTANLPDSPNRTKADDVKRPYLKGYPQVEHKHSPKKTEPTLHDRALYKKNESSDVKSLLSWE